MGIKESLFLRLREIKKFFDRRDFYYQCGRFTIKLPYDHNLRLSQINHPRYDRFLPHLAKYLPKKEFVIDVGANCGDTLASMITENNNLKFICIEADESFIKYLNYAAKEIQKKLQSKIIILKSLVGKELKSVTLEGKNGTRHAVTSKNKNNTLTAEALDDITFKNLKPSDKISLIKIDVDGFDYDVINSSEKIIGKFKPLIFFECDFQCINQKENYEKTINWLRDFGYSEWTIFDNFGSLLFQTSEVKHIFEIFDYLWEVKSKKTITIYYVDILASGKDNAQLVNQILTTY